MERALIDSVKGPAECERTHVFSGLDKPVIRFVPEKEVIMESTKTIDVQLRLNNMIGPSNFNCVHRKLPIYEGGPVETLLRWKKNLQETIIGKPCSNPQSKFTITKLLLGGDPEATWLEFERQKCETAAVGEHALGQTEDTYRATMVCFMEHYFPKTGNNARKQKRYMNNCLVKPRSVSIHQCALRLKQINGYLPLFPFPENETLSEGDLIQILVVMCPKSWQVKMTEHDFDPANHSFQQVLDQLIKWEVVEKLPNKNSGDANQPESNSKGKGKGDRRDKKKKRKWKEAEDKEYGGEDPPCLLCFLFKGNAKSHATKDCNKKPRILKFLQSGGNNKKKKFKSAERHELNALVKKTVQKCPKEKKKDKELDYTSDDVDSDAS